MHRESFGNGESREVGGEEFRDTLDLGDPGDENDTVDLHMAK